jgi:hypothetical protein
MLLTPRKYRAPAGDGEILIVPPLGEVPRLLDDAQYVQLPSQSIAGMSLSDWRALARSEVQSLLKKQTHNQQPTAWFVVGHQPDLVHPGVWLKYSVMSQLARRHNGIALNLIVDNDEPKAAAVRVPIWRPGIAADGVSVEAIPFDSPPGHVPYEEWIANDGDLFASFPDRLAAATKDWPFRPIGVPGWSTKDRRVVDVLSTVRRNQEISCGISNVELRVSQLCSTTAFGQFLSGIIDDLPRFRNCYNAAVRVYRAANKIKSRHHPVPDLIQDGDWQEAPFWCWSVEQPQRRRLFIRRNSHGIALRWGRRESNWPNPNVKIRPRALTLTLFTRLALADVFIHGIGGGKYDELTDSISASYFGVPPPTYMIVSGTLQLPLPRFAATPAAAAAAHRRDRDVLWNPQRHIALPKLAAERSKLIAMLARTRQQRREKYSLLRRNLSQWQAASANELLNAHDDRLRTEAELLANTVLGSREYSWVLYPAPMLCEWLTRERL